MYKVPLSSGGVCERVYMVTEVCVFEGRSPKHVHLNRGGKEVGNLTRRDMRPVKCACGG